MTPFLFTHNRFNPYAKTKDNQSQRTRQRKFERNRFWVAWNSGRKGTYVFEKHGELK